MSLHKERLNALGEEPALHQRRTSGPTFHNLLMSRTWKPSVTVAAVISRTLIGVQQFLLVEEETPEGLRLNNPAGHLDPAESPQQAVVREALEETTCTFTPTCLVGTYLSRFQRAGKDGSADKDITYLRFAFGGTVGEPNPALTLDHGIHRTLWVSLAELRSSASRHRSPLVLRCVEDFVAGRAFPLDSITTDASVCAVTTDASVCAVTTDASVRAGTNDESVYAPTQPR